MYVFYFDEATKLLSYLRKAWYDKQKLLCTNKQYFLQFSGLFFY